MLVTLTVLLHASDCVLTIEYSHHDVIVPLTINKSGFPLPALDYKAAFFVCSNRPAIVVDNAHGETMQAKLMECVLLNEPDCLSAKSFPKTGKILDANCQRRSTIAQVNAIEADATDG